MNEVKTIKIVVENNLCLGCGTCAALCPNKAIKITIDKKRGVYVPEIDFKKCINCGLCYQACPGHSVNFKELDLEIFGKEPKDILLGNYLNCYVGYSEDKKIRYDASSGGLITQLLIFALQERIIDGALVTKMKKDNPFQPHPFIAKTKTEIIEASKSKYCPVPANIALKEILESEKNKKFAVVGLPCHIQAIRKAEKLNEKLKEKIVLHIGLFCSQVPNFLGTEFLLKKIKVKKEKVTKLDYRGEGWPGSMKILTDKKESLIPLPVYWIFFENYCFTPFRCLMCSDGANELADLSVGDAWLPETLGDQKGQSIIISRNYLAEEILQKMKLQNLITLNEIKPQTVIQSQQHMLYLKKKNLNARIKLSRKTINYNNTLKPDTIDYFLALYPYLNQKITTNGIFRFFLEIFPLKIIKLYKSIFDRTFGLLCHKRMEKVIKEQKTMIKKTVKIAIINHGSKFNKGDSALLNSRIQTLKEVIPEAEFSVFTFHPEIDNSSELKYLQNIDTKFYGQFCQIKKSPKVILKIIILTCKFFLYRIGFHKIFNNDKKAQEYLNADVIINTGGDGLTEDYGPFSWLNYAVNIWFGLILNKPVVIYGESIGPFKKRINKLLAKFLFNRISLITLREEISKKILDELNILKPPIYITADSAFLLKPAPDYRIKEIISKEKIENYNKPFIGISPSKIIAHYGFLELKDDAEKYNKYIHLMSKIVDYLIEKLGATVIFIPHVIEPWGNDDREVADDIIRLAKNKLNCVSIKGDYTTEEIKGIISKCDLFIGARMHAMIASTSMLVPTIGIAYSHKTHGIIGKMLGQENYVLDIKEINYDTFISKINEAWNNKEKIKKDLELKINEIKKKAMLNAELVRNLILENKK
ncbi:MAG: polysaccharide pyruvyl transferase family protein [Minisyncoccia bacterium]